MIVLDTHALIWAVDGDPRLGRTARATLDEAGGTDGIGVSAITPWEIALLVEKGRLRLGCDAGTWIDSALDLPGVRLLPIEPAIAIDSVRLPGSFHADPADRLILATARYSRAPLLTADGAMIEYAKGGHLRVVDASL
ncbi:MAG: type II toxin-antitoxin system VapC family toxin [Acidobacteria bacterium]|nr:type II toxin-antitoxin system VapC family toxin [Acidobacteriota bacterium]